MRENRNQVIAWIGMSEGGFIDHPKDPGGRTNKGITQSTYNAWLRSKGRATKDVLNITKAEADLIVSEQYMDPVKFDGLPSGLDYAVADFSVNSGPARAAKELQQILGMTGAQVDGIIGDKTLAMIERTDLESLIIGYNRARMAYLRRLGTWKTFGKGWTARVMGQLDGFQSNDIGVIDRAVMLARGRASIPAPVAHERAKSTDSQITKSAMLAKVMEDPVAFVPVVGTIGGLFSGDGPAQWALAGVVLIGAAYVAMRALRRGA